MARSVCTRKISHVHDGVCPRFEQIFVRDLYPHLTESINVEGWQDLSKTTCLQRQLPTDHPCKGRSVRSCIADLVLMTRPPLDGRRRRQRASKHAKR